MPDFHLKPLGEKLIQQPSAIGTVASKSAFLAPACGSKAFVEGSLLLSQRGLFFAAPHDDIFGEKKRMTKNHAIMMNTLLWRNIPGHPESDTFMAMPMPCIISPASAPTSVSTLTQKNQWQTRCKKLSINLQCQSYIPLQEENQFWSGCSRYCMTFLNW